MWRTSSEEPFTAFRDHVRSAANEILYHRGRLNGPIHSVAEETTSTSHMDDLVGAIMKKMGFQRTLMITQDLEILLIGMGLLVVVEQEAVMMVAQQSCLRTDTSTSTTGRYRSVRSSTQLRTRASWLFKSLRLEERRPWTVAAVQAAQTF